MAENSCPQVFVVERPTSHVQLPIKKKSVWSRASKRLLLPVLALVVSGLVLEGIFIFRLYKKTEGFFLHQNPSSPKTLAVDGKKLEQVGPEEYNELPIGLEQINERPMAHLQGSDAVGQDGVVQWVKNSDGFTSHIEYNKTGLVIEKNGFYFIYSKVHLQETKDCVMVSHCVKRNTTAYYGHPIELMKSKSFHCRNERSNQRPKEKDLWNSFLAGIFKLNSGDLIFVTLDKGLYPGPADNFLGAVMLI